MNNKVQRNIALDIIRTVAVISAIWLHANYYLLLPGNLIPHGFNQRVAYIGYVFAFVGGYIAANGYLDKFKQDAFAAALKLVYKGLKLAVTLAVYVYIMSLISGKPIVDYWEFVYPTRYMNRAISAFALMYMTVPLLLQTRLKLKHAITSVVIALIVISIGVYAMTDPGFPSKTTTLFFDYRNNIYPLMFMLGAYMLGLWWGESKAFFLSERIKPQLRLLVYAIVSVLLIAQRPQINGLIPSFAAWQIIIGSLTLASLMYMLESLFQIIPSRVVPQFITIPGKQSLTFYMTGNAVIDLIYKRPTFQWDVRGWGTMLATLGIAYVVSAIWPIQIWAKKKQTHTGTT